jgi:hypothetical protein
MCGGCCRPPRDLNVRDLVGDSGNECENFM